MPGPRSARVPLLTLETRGRLVQLTRSPSAPAGVTRRARIVVLAADGVPLRQIARRVGCDRNVVRDWLDRFREQGLAGLQDRPRPGRARAFSP
jgi:predicted ArsR family transcriptional regulator